MCRSLSLERREGRQKGEGGTRRSSPEGEGTKGVDNQNDWTTQKRASAGRRVQVGTAGCWADLR